MRTAKVWVETQTTNSETGEKVVREDTVSLSVSDDGVVDVSAVPVLVKSCENYLEIGTLIEKLEAKRASHKEHIKGVLNIAGATHVTFGNAEVGLQLTETTRKSFDQKSFKEKHAKLFQKFLKSSTVRSLRKWVRAASPKGDEETQDG